MPPAPATTLARGVLLAGLLLTPALGQAAPGMVDPDFHPALNAPLLNLLVQPDGRVVAGGSFTTVDGSYARQRLVRLTSGGAVDPSFSPYLDGTPVSTTLLADGRILAVGGISSVTAPEIMPGVTAQGIVRLHPDGSLDTTQTVNSISSTPRIALAVPPPGNSFIGTLFGGDFFNFTASFNTYYYTGFGAFDSNGILLGAPLGGSQFSVSCLAAEPGGSTVFGGNIGLSPFSPPPNPGIPPSPKGAARLSSGSLMLAMPGSFTPAFDGQVNVIAVQADGKILTAGNFYSYGADLLNFIPGTTRQGFARLQADGTLDMGFDPQISGGISSLVVQADGKIILGGNFSSVGGTPRTNLARVNPDGTLDPTFAPQANENVGTMALQADGSLLIGGHFTQVNGQPRQHLARLTNDPGAQMLTRATATTLRWMRSGSVPEVSTTIFEHSANGTSWTTLGPGTRIPGGWEITSPTLPSTGSVRARGWTIGGNTNGTSGIVQSVLNLGGTGGGTPPPAFTTWLATRGSTGADPLSDPDHNGTTLWQEWVLGTDLPGTTPPQQFTVPAGSAATLPVTVTWRQGAPAPRVQFTTDPGAPAWVTAAPLPAGTPAAGGTQTATLTLTPPPGSTRLFLRLDIPPP